MDNLLPVLRELGSDVRLFKIDIFHLGMMWKDKYYVEKFLVFGVVYGTEIFQRITDFVRFILAKQGIEVYNYIDDIYACSHKQRNLFKH